jgi:signal peptidase I
MKKNTAKPDLSKNSMPSANRDDQPVLGYQPPASAWDNMKIFLWETFKVVIISLVIIVPVRFYLIQPFYVQGASMEPNFFDNEYLIIDEITYRFSEPQRGDIVVFRYPRDPSQFFIKRIIGLPGEKVFIKDGQVKVAARDDEPQQLLDEVGYLAADMRTPGNIQVLLGMDEYYLLGDNRAASLDSRSFGPVSRSAIVGRTWLRGWPLNRLTLFERLTYQSTN